MDNLLEALKTGSAFQVNRERRGEGRRRTPRAAGGKYSTFSSIFESNPSPEITMNMQFIIIQKYS